MTVPAPRSLHDFGLPDLESLLEADGVKRHHARALYAALFRHGTAPITANAFQRPLRHWVEHSVGEGKPFFLEDPAVVEELRSSDGMTRKFLLRLRDGHTIETVLMAFKDRYTACVSTQVGCAMGCVFCATGQMGFVRHLRPGEIIAQVLLAKRMLHEEHSVKRLRNLVLMGMGEPLHNYEAVMEALETISDPGGCAIGPSHTTISTVGVVPGILRLAEEKRPYLLAVSLHGSDAGERSALVPVARRWSLDSLIESCRHYGRITGRRIFFECTLIAGVNDSPETASRLALLLSGLDAHVNLIPLNRTDGYHGTMSDLGTARQFQKILVQAGIPSTFRQHRGIDVAAGCGMLKSQRGGIESFPVSR